ncbi:MAG: hypothetical protein WBS22_06870 [Methylocystis sp.]
MGNVSVRIHDAFQARATRERAGPSGRPLREMSALLADRERRNTGARVSVGLSRAVSVFFELSLLLGGFCAGALAFAYLSRRW